MVNVGEGLYCILQVEDRTEAKYLESKLKNLTKICKITNTTDIKNANDEYCYAFKGGIDSKVNLHIYPSEENHLIISSNNQKPIPVKVITEKRTIIRLNDINVAIYRNYLTTAERIDVKNK